VQFEILVEKKHMYMIQDSRPVNVLGRFYKQFLTSLYRSTLVYFWNQTRNKNICKLNKGNSL